MAESQNCKKKTKKTTTTTTTTTARSTARVGLAARPNGALCGTAKTAVVQGRSSSSSLRLPVTGWWQLPAAATLWLLVANVHQSAHTCAAWTTTTTSIGATTTFRFRSSISSRRGNAGGGGATGAGAAPFWTTLGAYNNNNDELADAVPEWNDFEDTPSSFVQPIPIVYNDFGTILIGDTAEIVVASDSAQLSERMSVVQDRQVRQSAIDARNWKLGNWQVRGVSFEDSDNASFAVSVTRIVQNAKTMDGGTDAINDNGPQLVWVGRSDGSIWAVRLGTEYWTKLGMNPLDNEPSQQQPLPQQPETTIMPWSESDNDDDENEDNDELLAAAAVTASPKVLQPSRVVARLVRSDNMSEPPQPIVALVAVPVDDDDDDDDETTRVFATRAQPGNVIDAWQVTITDDADHSDNDSDNDRAFTNTQALVGGHDDGQSIVALQAVAVNGLQWLVSMDRSGGVALWNGATGSLQARFSVSDSDDAEDSLGDPNPSAVTSSSTVTACSLWVTTSHILVGTSSGQVLAYAMAELLDSTNGHDDATVQTTPVVLAGRWRASNHAITAMAGGGAGVMGKSGQSRTTVLFTGDAQGLVKRWELLSGGGTSTRLDAWPKLATQRLPKRAHVFAGHDDEITALRAIDGTKFVSAGLDGTGTYTRVLCAVDKHNSFPPILIPHMATLLSSFHCWPLDCSLLVVVGRTQCGFGTQ
jgi:hypothetical protein